MQYKNEGLETAQDKSVIHKCLDWGAGNSVPPNHPHVGEPNYLRAPVPVKPFLRAKETGCFRQL